MPAPTFRGPFPYPHGARLGRAVGAWDQDSEDPASRLLVGWHARRRAAVQAARHLGPHGPWRAALARAMAPAEGKGPWPVRALVVDGAWALGLGPEVSAGLLAAAYLWHAAADGLDDAMDGDAPQAGPPKAPWARTATGGLAFMQLAPDVACASAAPELGQALRRVFARSGMAMAKGQDRDVVLAELWAHGPWPKGGPWPTPPGGWIAAWEAAARGKAGGAMALYAALPALSLGLPRPLVAAMWALGEALGLAWQLTSDLADHPGPGQSPGLEQLLALAAIEDQGERQLAWSSWEGVDGAPPWQAVRELSGAGSMTQARLVQAWAEAETCALAVAAMEGADAAALGEVALAWVEEGREAAKTQGVWGLGEPWGGAWV